MWRGPSTELDAWNFVSLDVFFPMTMFSALSITIVGILLVFTSALTFSLNNALAVVAYQGGSTPVTLLVVRMAFTLVVLTMLLRATGAVIRLPRRQRNGALVLGLFNGIMAICIMTAFDYIPVGLAILLLYLNPIFTGIGAWALGREKLDSRLVAGLVLCFAGLALALEFDGGQQSYLGMFLAFLAAVLLAVTLLWGSRILETDNARAVTLHMHVSATMLMGVLWLVTGDFVLPLTQSGWIGLCSVPIVYTVAILTFLSGIPRLGPIRTAMLMNLEPIATIGLGFLLLGQSLSVQQLIGAVIVISGISLVKLSGNR